MEERSVVMRKLVGCVRKALTDYNMLEAGDHVAVGLSGGKDSLALLTALAIFKRFSPIPFELSAITISLGLKETDPKEVQALIDYCKELGVTYYIEETQIAQILFEERKEKNPCSLCSKMRRGALNTKCKEIGANKLALGHNSEDLLETFLLSFIYEGRLSTFQPVSHMERSDITLIRPFIYAREGDIKGVCARLNLPILHNPCPMNHVTQREYMKNLTMSICKDIPFAKDRMFSAITSPERYNLFPHKTPKKDD